MPCTFAHNLDFCYRIENSELKMQTIQRPCRNYRNFILPGTLSYEKLNRFGFWTSSYDGE